MKSGEREAYLPGSGNTEGSSNNGSGHGGFPLLVFFPSACLLLPFMLTVFSRCLSLFSFFVCPHASFISSLLLVFFFRDEGTKVMMMPVLSGGSSFSACFFLCFLALFFFLCWVLFCLFFLCFLALFFFLCIVSRSPPPQFFFPVCVCSSRHLPPPCVVSFSVFVLLVHRFCPLCFLLSCSPPQFFPPLFICCARYL